ncbi:MAG: hypothetical protein KDJ38_19875, partial [Gammaproteobacteria bacterium]|nr:hypothetical protein [Gammaproteobacteria bacterium]
RLPDDGETELEGVITWVNDARSVFEISHLYTVEVNSATRFEDGSADNLAVGQWVEVSLNGERLLEVDFEIDSSAGVSIPVATGSRPFELEGAASYADGLLQINDFSFVVDSQTRLDDGLSLAELNGAQLDIEGLASGESYRIKEIERRDNDADMDIQGPVDNGTLWGYGNSDGSLDRFNGQWVELDCRFDGVNLAQCRLDD